MKIFALALGNLTGGFARYYLAGSVYRSFGTAFPHGTLIVNLLGCLLVRFLASLADERFLIGPHTKLFLMVGFCGAFTTFSTFMLETANLMKEGQAIHAFLNVFLSRTARSF